MYIRQRIFNDILFVLFCSVFCFFLFQIKKKKYTGGRKRFKALRPVAISLQLVEYLHINYIGWNDSNISDSAVDRVTEYYLISYSNQDFPVPLPPSLRPSVRPSLFLSRSSSPRNIGGGPTLVPLKVMPNKYHCSKNDMELEIEKSHVVRNILRNWKWLSEDYSILRSNA